MRRFLAATAANASAQPKHAIPASDWLLARPMLHPPELPVSLLAAAMGVTHWPVGSHTFGGAQSFTLLHCIAHLPSVAQMNGVQSCSTPNELTDVWPSLQLAPDTHLPALHW
jgi:hypothetical protein